MKERVIYIGAFLLAFIFVSSAIIYVNTLFKNIFKFDFTPVSQLTHQAQASQPPKTDAANGGATAQNGKTDSTRLGYVTADSLKKLADQVKLDTASTITLKDTNAVKKVKNVVATQANINQVQVSSENNVANVPVRTSPAQKDTSYSKWIKKTGKLYESMDAKKAAKIILGYSDNIARDLLLSMRKKKAAEILSEFKPEIATRIISVN